MTGGISPLIVECPLNFECMVVNRIEVGRGAIYFAEVVETHVNEDVVKGRGEFNIAAFDPIVYGPDRYYRSLGESLGREHELYRSIIRRE